MLISVGHATDLKAYRQHIGKEESDKCEKCEEGDETIENVLYEDSVETNKKMEKSKGKLYTSEKLTQKRADSF